MGGCRWTRCPRNSDFEPHSPRYAPCLVSGCWCTLRKFRGFLAPNWAVSRTYRGARGRERALVHGTRCPGNRILSHVAQDTARACFEGVGAHCADFGAFWRFFGPFLGHFVELKDTRGLFETVKSSPTCGIANVSLRLGVLSGFGRCFGRKMAAIGPKLRRFGRAPPNLAPPPPAPTGTPSNLHHSPQL